MNETTDEFSTGFKNAVSRVTEIYCCDWGGNTGITEEEARYLVIQVLEAFGVSSQSIQAICAENFR